MSCAINKNTVNLNVQESLPILLRMVDPEEFSKYASMTPTALDFLANYEDAVKRQEFQIDATATGAAARPIVYYPGAAEQGPAADANFFGTRPFSYTSYQNNVLAYDMNRPAGTAYYHKPRGSWKVNRIYALDDALAPRVPILADTVVYVEFDVCEPLLLSPFVFGSGYGKQGFYGIQAMTFNLVTTGHANRAWRCATFAGARGANAIKTATVESFQNSRLLFQFITPRASDMLDPRNVVPYYEKPYLGPQATRLFRAEL